MEKIIKVSNLKKKYHDFEAVKGISFEVKTGDLFAFLGTNGAGKSTTINMLTTLIEKTAGEVFINDLTLGKDDAKIKKLIGVVYQNSTLDDLLTVSENLYVRGSLYSYSKSELKKRIDNIAKITKCTSYLNQKYGKLSGGQRRRVDIACALLHEPRILFLDEPTTGLDPETRISIWETISDMQKQLNTTVFLTTHYMEEAAKADDVIIIKDGMIVEHDTPMNLKKKYTVDVIKMYDVHDELLHMLTSDHVAYTLDKNVLEIKFNDSNQAIHLLSKYKELINSFEVIHGNMDDVFLNVLESEGS